MKYDHYLLWRWWLFIHLFPNIEQILWNITCKEIPQCIISDLMIWISDFTSANSSLKTTNNNSSKIVYEKKSGLCKIKQFSGLYTLFHNAARKLLHHYSIPEKITLIRKWGSNLNFGNTECKMCIMLTI